jgi:dipeptidyl aminopeptidase/acylaminoacyl peptidase
MRVSAVVLTCLAAVAVAGCRNAEPAASPPAEPTQPKLRLIAAGHSAQWTADGRIAYVASKGRGVWSIRPDGKRARRLVAVKYGGLLVSPDRSRMLFMDAGGSRVARTDGSRLRPITTLSQASTARWSDDGARITFQRQRGSQGSIWSVPTRGGRAKPLFREFGGFVLAWAPDGRMVVAAFQEQEGGSFSATLLIAPGEEPREIPELVEARFGPDGTVEGIESQGSYVVLDDRGEVLRRFPGDRVRNLPDYTADGTLMTYEQSGRLWIAFADWTARRMLADALCSRPAFSPDDTRIACSVYWPKRHVAVIDVPAELR